MKRIALAGLALAVSAMFVAVPVANAGSYDENVGCGLGNMVFKDGGKDSTLLQILAVTTNGTSGNQTFGITSGTLGCKTPANFVSVERLNKFVADNMDTLARDIAAGKGETVTTLAELMNVSDASRPAFFATLKSNFSNIYTSDAVSSADVIDNIARVI